MIPLPPISTLFPYTTLFRSIPAADRGRPRVHRRGEEAALAARRRRGVGAAHVRDLDRALVHAAGVAGGGGVGGGVHCADRKSTRLNSSHSQISYAVFCLKKK